MKKLEIELLLQDFDNANLQIKKKLKKLDTIILYYMEDNGETILPKEEPIVEQEIIIDEVITDEQPINEEIPHIEDEIIEDDLPHKEKLDNLPPDIKVLYRKIMIKTHPDKNKGVDNSYYEELYREAVKAKDENDKPTLLYIAYELGLDELYEIDPSHFGSIKKRIAELEIKIKSLDNNPFIIWYNTDNVNLKKVMIDQITKMRTNIKKR